MKNLLLTLVTTLTLVATTQAQRCNTRVEFSSNRKPVAIYDIMANYSGYGKKQYTGTITRVEYASNELDITGFIIELLNGIREEVDITHDDCVSKLDHIEKGWVPYIIKRGNKVRVDAEISGSGGFINARNIIILNEVNRPTRKKVKKR